MFEEIRNRREEIRNNILKSFNVDLENWGGDIEKAHQDGEIHKNGKYVWVSSAAGGKGDWRKLNGRTHKNHQANNGGGGSVASTTPKSAATTTKNTNNEQNTKKDGGSKLKAGSIYEKFANYYKFQKNNGVKYPSFAIVREAKSENNGRGAIEFVGTKKEFQEAIKKFNSATNSNISIDNFEREHSYGEVKWSATFNSQDGKLYKNDGEIPKQKTSNSTKTKSSKSNSSVSSITTVDDAATFLRKNVDKWSDYQYEELDDKKLEKQFDEANKYIKDFKQFDWKEEDEANAYKEKMEKKGYKIVDLGEGSDTYIFAVLKKSNKK